MPPQKLLVIPLTSSPHLFTKTFRCCHHAQHLPAARAFSSTRPAFASTKRKMQTSTAHRPLTLDPPPPPPQVASLPTADAVLPRVNETRPPTLPASALSQQPSAQPSASQEKPVKPQPRRTLRPLRAALTLTPSAVSHLRELSSGPTPKLIKVGVRNRGCSGLAYHLEYVEGAGRFDEVVETEGVRVCIDSKALMSVMGSEMDWVQEGDLKNGFVFRNPNIKEQCGCGESFMV